MNKVSIDGIEYVEAGSVLPITEDNGPWQVGKIYHVRTVTFSIAGVLEWVGDKELLFSEASWIADSGRFSDYLKGKTDSNLEVEPFKEKVIVGRGSVIDATIIEDYEKKQR